LHNRAQHRYALREGTVDHPLSKTPLFVGRGSDADIVLAGPLVSRRHAEFHETEAGVVVIDLDSQNGVLVNGVAIARPTALLIGDKVTIGDNELVLTEVGSVKQGRRSDPELELRPASEGRRSDPELNPIRESGRVPAGTYSSSSEEPSIATRRADALHLLSNVADKALALGRGQEAEHVLGTHLVAALSDAVSGRAVAPEVARIAAQYAVKLASATGKASWLDFAFRLYDALATTIPLPIVDEMYTVLRHVRGIDRELLRRYTDFLHERAAELSPPERFVLQRLEGLERLAAWHPAN
jgi:hypothetical protein